MDTFNEVWAIVLLAAVPIAGFVGFIVHALTVRKSSLEIQKLRYEIERLKSEQGKRESLIEIANFDQVMRFTAKDRTMDRLAYAPRRGLYFALVLLVVAIVIVVVYLFFHGVTK